jgi:hypothetical protein
MKKVSILAFALLAIKPLAAQTIKEKDVPQIVVDAFNKDYPYGHDQNVTWGKNKENYEAEYGSDRAVLIAPTGKIIANKNAILTKNLPEAILNYFRDVEKTEKLVEAERVIMVEDGAVFFLVVTKNHFYKFDTLGKLISNEPFNEISK